MQVEETQTSSESWDKIFGPDREREYEKRTVAHMSREGRGPVIDLQKARQRILEHINQDRAAFQLRFMESIGEEYMEFCFVYEICGVHYEKKDGLLRLIVSLNGKGPQDVKVDTDTLIEKLQKDVRIKLPFLLKDTFYVSVDTASLENLKRSRRLEIFRRELEEMVTISKVTLDDALPVLFQYVDDNMKHTNYNTLEELSTGNEPSEAGYVLEILPIGIPCPHCMGLISEEDLQSMVHDFHLRFGYRE